MPLKFNFFLFFLFFFIFFYFFTYGLTRYILIGHSDWTSNWTVIV